MAIAANLHNTTFHVGDTVRVHYRIIEKEVVSGKTKKEKHEEQKDRIQVYEGIVLAIRGSGDGKSFVVRRMGIGNIGIERIFPFISPWIKKITIKKKGNVRRAKLYYLREKTAKEVASIGQLVKQEDVEKISAPATATQSQQKPDVAVKEIPSQTTPQTTSVTPPAVDDQAATSEKKANG